MISLIRSTTKPVLIVGGAATALAGVAAFLPRFALEQMQQIAFVTDYVIIVQHWGIMVCLMGLCMIGAAFWESWRVPILLYSLVEKSFMVALYLANIGAPFAKGFLLPAVMDSVIVVWLAMYFAARRSAGAAPGSPIGSSNAVGQDR